MLKITQAAKDFLAEMQFDLRILTNEEQHEIVVQVKHAQETDDDWVSVMSGCTHNDLDLQAVFLACMTWSYNQGARDTEDSMLSMPLGDLLESMQDEESEVADTETYPVIITELEVATEEAA